MRPLRFSDNKGKRPPSYLIYLTGEAAPPPIYLFDITREMKQQTEIQQILKIHLIFNIDLKIDDVYFKTKYTKK